MIEKFDFKYFCVNCLSCNELCVFPYYCSRSYPIIASSYGAASSGPTNDSMISQDVTAKQNTINLRNKNEKYKNKQKETHKNSPEFVENFNVLSNFTDKKEDNSLKFITDPNFTNIEASDVCKSNPLVKYFRKKPEDKCIIEAMKCSQKPESDQIVFATMNPAGLNSSKSKVIEKIVALNKIQVLVICETNASGSEIPFISNDMTAFHRNRNSAGKCKGGVSIFVNKTLASQCIIREKGSETWGDEYIVLRMNCFTVPVVLFAMYGKQEVGLREDIRNRWRRLFGVLEDLKNDGNVVLAMGDWNVAIGNHLNMTRNDESVSIGGKEVIKLVHAGDWEIMNHLCPGDQRSHYDRR